MKFFLVTNNQVFLFFMLAAMAGLLSLLWWRKGRRTRLEAGLAVFAVLIVIICFNLGMYGYSKEPVMRASVAAADSARKSYEEYRLLYLAEAQADHGSVLEISMRESLESLKRNWETAEKAAAEWRR